MEEISYVKHYKKNVGVLVLPEYQEIVAAAISDRNHDFEDLLANMEDINTVVDTHGNTLLNVMTILERVYFFRLIIDREEANLNLDTILAATDKHGNTALHFAAYKGNKIMFNALTKMKYGAATTQRLAATNHKNQTPAMVAQPNLKSIIDQLNLVESSRSIAAEFMGNV